MAVEVKICGLTRGQDAEAACRAGADWLGVVFAGGPRVVGWEQAAAIVAAARGRPVLGVFGSEPPSAVVDLCRRARLSGAQLHGAYTASDAAYLRSAGLIVWRVVRLSDTSDLATLDEPWEVHAVLVEPKVPHAAGGSGAPLSGLLARQARERLRGRRMVLAGGLRPDTVAEAVGLVAPDVVDVSSGVETLPGIKDEGKIAGFVEAARGRSAVA